MGFLIEERDFGGVAEACQAAINRGRTLQRWWNASPELAMNHLPDSRPGTPMEYFFSGLEMECGPISLLGCLQTSTFQSRPEPGQPEVSLAQWVARNFLRQARWKNPDGSRGGFSYRPVIALDHGADVSAVRRLDETADEFAVADIGSRFAWAAVRLDLLDYMRPFPVVGRFNKWLQPFNKEAGYLVLHPDFLGSPRPRPERCVEEFSFAYSVAPWTVMPTMAAYGPGRFFAAYKEFRFFLMEDRSVSIQVLFLVTPRCQKVLNVLGVDPVFGTAAIVDALTLRGGRLNRAAHAGIDRFAMQHHCRVHENLLNGMAGIWEGPNWQPSSAAVRGPGAINSSASI